MRVYTNLKSGVVDLFNAWIIYYDDPTCIFTRLPNEQVFHPSMLERSLPHLLPIVETEI